MVKFKYENGLFMEIKKEQKVLKKWHTYVLKSNEKVQYIPYLKDEIDPEIVEKYEHYENCYQCKLEKFK